MNFDKPTDEQLGLKKKNAEGLDIESAELVPETEEVLKRVNIKHPEMVLEIALAGRDIKRAEAYEQSLQNNPEAMQVWKAIKNTARIIREHSKLGLIHTQRSIRCHSPTKMLSLWI